MDTQDLKNGLRNFYGTEQWFRHPLNRNMLYTEGVQFFAQNAGGGAYWYLDIIATEVFQLLAKHPFMHLFIEAKDGKAELYATNGNNKKKVWERQIGLTDMPEGEWQFYLTDNVLLLTSEY